MSLEGSERRTTTGANPGETPERSAGGQGGGSSPAGCLGTGTALCRITGAEAGNGAGKQQQRRATTESRPWPHKSCLLVNSNDYKLP